jgi:hypothetical protein
VVGAVPCTRAFDGNFGSDFGVDIEVAADIGSVVFFAGFFAVALGAGFPLLVR